jgi:hypothetical protein
LKRKIRVPALVSGQRVQVKKLARDLANSRSTIVLTGPSQFQDPGVIAARQKSLQQYTDAIGRYPQADFPTFLAMPEILRFSSRWASMYSTAARVTRSYGRSRWAVDKFLASLSISKYASGKEAHRAFCKALNPFPLCFSRSNWLITITVFLMASS